MGVLEFLFGRREKKKAEPIVAPKSEKLGTASKPMNRCITLGHIDVDKIVFDVKASEAVKRRFIAFDVETTGLSPISDRIVELGAVLFVDGKPIERFSSLVNPGIRISPSASAVNHITNEMLNDALTEAIVYPKLISFLGSALQGEILMCAHNASFDFSFLSNTLSRLGYNGAIRYIDTLSLARRYIPGLSNYKQCTIEAHLSFHNLASHRACTDAENCGYILVEIINCSSNKFETEKKRIEAASPTSEELAVCAFIQKIIFESGEDTSGLRFRRNSSNYVEATCLYSFLKFKFAKKGHFLILRKTRSMAPGIVIEPCTESEGGTDYIRIYFSRASDLQPFAKEIIALFIAAQKSMNEYSSHSQHAAEETKAALNQMIALTCDDVENLLLNESQRSAAPIDIVIEPTIPREAVTIVATHSRVPLSEIKNANDWEKGFDAGFKYYEKGEDAKRNGHIEEAIAFYDKARYHGYCAPALYNAYAIAYRQLKDYQNEIVILEEGMIREPYSASHYEARRDKAIKLLFAQQDAARKATEKAQIKAEKLAAKESEKVNRQPRGRCIRQMDDAGSILAEFDTVAAATKAIGISSKSIRDAANGVQQHAGGYRWAYKEEL